MFLYTDKKVLITGGLGFLGSNLAIKLVKEGLTVTILDSLDNRYGGNLFNIEEIKRKINIVFGDVCNKTIVKPLIRDADIIFHFAAQVSYIDSLKFPLEDLDKNALSTLLILEICRELNHRPLIIFSSSRMVLGYVQGKQFHETDIPKPLSLYAVHKLLSENYLNLYYREFRIPYIILRITNPYGPRQQIKHNKYSLIGWFIRMAMNNETIKIYGEGTQMRDYIFANDIVEGIYRVGVCELAQNKTINLGSGNGVEFRDMVQTVINTVGKGKIEFIPWPIDYEKLETGDAVADISLLKELTDFLPKFSLHEGVLLTYQYYKKNSEYYL